MAGISADTIAVITVGLAILAFLWSLHRDVADLRERLARLEGLFEGFIRNPDASTRNRAPSP